jgi:hypothetical protein
MAIMNWQHIQWDSQYPFCPLYPQLFAISLVMTPQSATVMQFMQLVHSRLKSRDRHHVWINGSEFLGDEGFERYHLCPSATCQDAVETFKRVNVDGAVSMCFRFHSCCNGFL